jgi:hypothetical protein
MTIADSYLGDLETANLTSFAHLAAGFRHDDNIFYFPNAVRRSFAYR